MYPDHYHARTYRWTDRRDSWNSYLVTQLLSLPKFESNAQKGMSNIVQEAFEYKHLAMAILCLCPPDRSTPSSPTSVSSLSGKILISASRSHAIKTFLYLFSLKFQGHFKTQVYFNFMLRIKYVNILQSKVMTTYHISKRPLLQFWA